MVVRLFFSIIGAIAEPWGVPMPDCGPAWPERFGLPLVEVYGLTDAGVPAYQPPQEPHPEGSCGRVIPEYNVRIGDDDGSPVPDWTPGEILIRSDEPGLVMHSYLGMHEAIQTAFRGGCRRRGMGRSLTSGGPLSTCHFPTAAGLALVRRRGYAGGAQASRPAK